MFPNTGMVYQLSSSQQEELQRHMAQYPTAFQLVVTNRTYDVDEEQICFSSNTASKLFYKNTKLHVHNKSELVLAYLAMG